MAEPKNGAAPILRAAVLIAMALVAQAAAAPPGDRTMQPVSPSRFYESRFFADMAAVGAAGVRSIVTVEHSAQRVPGGPDRPPTETATLRVWGAAQSAGPLQEQSRIETSLPVAKAIAMTVRNGHLLALAQSNNVDAAYLLTLPWPLSGPLLPAPPTLPISLEGSPVAPILIDPRADWSTAGMTSAEWLFHPSMADGPAAGDVALAMNTADGQAVVWTSAAGATTRAPHAIAAIPSAIDPVFVHAGASRYLLYRRIPAGWSVYFHDLRYSGRYGPVALPLIMAEIGATGSIVRSVDLSATAALGGVLAFCAQADGSDLALAVVAGATAQPDLRVLVVNHAGTIERPGYAGLLRGVPYRLTMSVAESAALVGLAYRGQGTYVMDAATVALR